MTVANDLRCTVQAAELGESPGGSAGFARRVLLVELPLPWPKKIDQHELLTGIDLGLVADVKILGVRAGDDAMSDHHRIICWERSEPFRGFVATETVVERADLAARVEDIGRRGREAITKPLALDADHQDLLICTHGTRDRCCGQFGTLLHLELESTLPPNVRLWRASHTGGHRFAPTGVQFPAGATWSFLTADLTSAIINRSFASHALDGHFRGNLGIEGRPAQIAEGLAFFDQGWDFLDNERTVHTEIDRDGLVTATVHHHRGTHTVTMRPVDAIPVPACGEPIDASTKATPQFEVVARTVVTSEAL